MRKSLLVLTAATLLGMVAAARIPQRKIIIPDTPEYKVLKCDFHVHTLFSDGWVWPAVRVQEAADEGLDAIAITDHLEYRPWSHLIRGDHNKAYEVAMGLERDEAILMPGEEVIVIRGAEISRDMPPGHWNAIFTRDNNPLDTPEWMDAFREARRQDAFIFWSHPGWYSHAPNETRWYPAHEDLFRAGYMMGIEVFNPFDGYYQEAFQWALDRGLTILCNTDTHWPLSQQYDYAAGEHRPVTLVFAREKSEEGIREALLAGRTAAFGDDLIIGREDMLRPLFEAILTVEHVYWEGARAQLILKNNSSLPVILDKAPGSEHLSYKRHLTVRPGESVKLGIAPVGAFDMAAADRLDLHFAVANFYVGAPNRPLLHSFRVERPRPKE